MSDVSTVPNANTHISVIENGNLVWVSKEQFFEKIKREQEALEQNQSEDIQEPESSGENPAPETGGSEPEESGLKIEIKEPDSFEVEIKKEQLELKELEPSTETSAESELFPEGTERIF